MISIMYVIILFYFASSMLFHQRLSSQMQHCGHTFHAHSYTLLNSMHYFSGMLYFPYGYFCFQTSTRTNRALLRIITQLTEEMSSFRLFLFSMILCFPTSLNCCSCLLSIVGLTQIYFIAVYYNSLFWGIFCLSFSPSTPTKYIPSTSPLFYSCSSLNLAAQYFYFSLCPF